MNQSIQSANTPAERFVRVTGWSMMGLSIATAVLAGLQLVFLIFMMLMQPDLRETMILIREDIQFPAWFRYVLGYLLEGLIIAFGLGLMGVVTSLAFLKKQRWAWWAFVVFAVLSVLGNVWGAWESAFAPPLDLSFLADLYPELPIGLLQSDGSGRASGILFSLFFALGFAWMVERLIDPAVRDVFKLKQ